MTRFLTSRFSLARANGKKIYPRGIYVLGDRPLPVIGERVVVTCEDTKKKFAGEVVRVDDRRHCYDADIDLSAEVTE